MSVFFSDDDRALIASRGLSVEAVLGQLEIFRNGPGILHLDRPAVIGDGITALTEGQAEGYASFYEAEKGLRPVKFVPASGAATRMWKALSAWRARVAAEGLHLLRRRAGEGDKEACAVLSFFENLPRFAFYGELESAAKAAGKNLAKLWEQENYGPILTLLLDRPGLGYKDIAKGLVPFHAGPAHHRTAFEEHLCEAVFYARDENGVCRLHFTVPEAQKALFEELLERIRPRCERDHGSVFSVEFSVQDRSTDTIAAAADFSPFRTRDGALLFRPAGHGALLKNLDGIRSSPIFLANIDNVVPDSAKKERALWKKALAGLLLDVKDGVHTTLSLLKKDPATLPAALRFAENRLSICPPPGLPGEKLPDFLQKALDRPIRVCGMVKNLGDPGGAPFWVRRKDGGASLEIVEQAQVRRDMEDQCRIFSSSTHFNPVDIVAWVHDARGRKYDLKRFTDPEAVFVSQKSQDGRELYALELPGLWNGSMSDWITVFVDVPMCAYNPVKSVNDLLSPSHCGQ